MNKQIFSKTFFGSLQLACILLLAACAPPAPRQEAQAPQQPQVYPPPPAEPRFVFERSLYGSGDVVPEDEGAALRQLLTGQGPTGGEGLYKPYAVAVSQGRVFVSDTVQRHINVFDLPNQRFYRIGDQEQGKLTKPAGLGTDRAGNLYVADSVLKAVVVFDKDGKYLHRIGGGDWFTHIGSVTIDPKGDRMYVVDIGRIDSKNHRVRVFNPVNGTHLFDFGTRGSGPGELNFPYQLAVGKEGRLYVVDTGNFRVQVFDHDGKYLKSFGGPGKSPGSFARPKGIAADAEGNLYVADAAFGNFQIFNPDGELLMVIGSTVAQDGAANYYLPSGLNVDEDGRVYFVDQWFGKVDVFRPVRLKAEQGYFAARNKPGAVKK